MADPFLAQITMFAGNFAPRGWALCDGQLLPISQYSALFSLLGTIYGGDGRTTFALPDLRGRVPMHAGNGPGLSNRPLGQRGGSEDTQLVVGNIPQIPVDLPIPCSTAGATTADPTNNFLASTARNRTYHNAADGTMGNLTGNVGGSGQAFTNLPPYQVINFIIALQGVFPSRN